MNAASNMEQITWRTVLLGAEYALQHSLSECNQLRKQVGMPALSIKGLEQENIPVAPEEVAQSIHEVSAIAAPGPQVVKHRKGGGMTPEGRKRLSEAMKKRWAVKQAPATVARRKAGGRRGI